MAAQFGSKRRDFHAAMELIVITPLSCSRPTREAAAKLIAEREPEVLVQALMKQMRIVRKELQEFRKYGHQKEAEAARRAELSVMPGRQKRA
ncbi:MAG: hypothetical protein WBL65_12390 [Bryobacteraceae bacterium]